MTTLQTEMESIRQPTQEAEQTQKIELRELLKRPDLLTQASYLLLSLKSFSPLEVAEKTRNFLQSGQVTPEDMSAFEAIRKEHQEKYNTWKAEGLKMQHDQFTKDGELEKETENLNELYCVHATDYLPLIEDDQIVIPTTFHGSEGDMLRTSVHFSLNHPVEPVATGGNGGGASWEAKDFVVITPFQEMLKQNGSPYGMLPEDTWWSAGVEKGVRLPKGTILIAKKGNDKITQLQNQEGIEIVEVDGYPYTKANKVMQEKGIKIIYPTDFKGGKKIADQLGSFYGYHKGNATREGANSYLRAEAVVQSGSGAKQAETVKQLVETFNEGNESQFPDWAESVRFQALAQLVFAKYFDTKDFPNIAFSHPENENYTVDFDEVSKAMLSHFNHKGGGLPALQQSPNFDKQMIAWVGLNVFNELEKMAKIGTNLTSISERMIKDRCDIVKNNLDIIPPHLIGTFITTIYPYL